MAAEYRTAKAVKAAAEKRTREGVLFIDCAVCGKRTRKLRSNIKNAKWPLTCGHKCRGKLMTGPVNPRYKGRWIDGRNGYWYTRPDLLEPEVRVLLPKPEPREVTEHRVVMAKLLGRWPERSEHVHHINGDKQDNRPENLTLMDWTKHSKEHKRVLIRLAVLEGENKALRTALAEARRSEGGQQTSS